MSNSFYLALSNRVNLFIKLLNFVRRDSCNPYLNGFLFSANHVFYFILYLKFNIVHNIAFIYAMSHSEREYDFQSCWDEKTVYSGERKKNKMTLAMRVNSFTLCPVCFIRSLVFFSLGVKYGIQNATMDLWTVIGGSIRIYRRVTFECCHMRTAILAVFLIPYTVCSWMWRTVIVIPSIRAETAGGAPTRKVIPHRVLHVRIKNTIKQRHDKTLWPKQTFFSQHKYNNLEF